MDHSDNDCPSIIVSDIPEGISEDKITIHFQKKKFGGGEVLNVRMFKLNETEKQSAIVIFEDAKDAANVLKHKHAFLNTPVIVKPCRTQIFSETRVVIQNKILHQFAAIKNQKFDTCLIHLANKYNLTFTIKEGPEEWLVAGHWIELNFFNSDIKETLKKSLMNSQVDNLNKDSTSNSNDLLSISKSNWAFLERNHTSSLLQVFSSSLLHSQEDDSSILQLNTFDGVEVLKGKLESFISLNCKTSEVKDQVSIDSNNPIFFQSYNFSQTDVSSSKANAFQNLDKEKNKLPNYIIKTFDFPRGIKVNICHGDITREVVDAIVNASNNKLFHSGGVAKAISDASKDGGSVQAWCHKHVEINGEIPVSNVILSKAGELPCQKIIHAIGPEWYRYGQESIKLLENTFLKCMKAADAENFTTLAVPLVSSGIFGVPKDIAAFCLVLAVAEFSNSFVQSLRNIRFIDPDLETTDIVKKAFEKFKSNGNSIESFRKLMKKDNSKGFLSSVVGLFSSKNTSHVQTKTGQYEGRNFDERKKENDYMQTNTAQHEGGNFEERKKGDDYLQTKAEQHEGKNFKEKKKENDHVLGPEMNPNQNYFNSSIIPMDNIGKMNYDISYNQNKSFDALKFHENSTKITENINYNNAIKIHSTSNSVVPVLNDKHDEFTDDDSLLQVDPDITVDKKEQSNNLKPIELTNLKLKAMFPQQDKTTNFNI